MSQPATQATTTFIFVVRFCCEGSQWQPRWRGRVEHVQSGQQVNFLAFDDLLRFLQRFGVGVALHAGECQDTATPPRGDARVVES